MIVYDSFIIYVISIPAHSNLLRSSLSYLKSPPASYNSLDQNIWRMHEQRNKWYDQLQCGENFNKIFLLAKILYNETFGILKIWHFPYLFNKFNNCRLKKAILSHQRTLRASCTNTNVLKNHSPNSIRRNNFYDASFFCKKLGG